MTPTEKEWWLGSLMLLLGAGLFAIDILTPLAFANHFLYATVVLVATASRFQFMPLIAAGLGTLLTAIGMVISPPLPHVPLWLPIGNRTFTIFVLWVLVWFAWKRRQAEAKLKRVNEGLEEPSPCGPANLPV